MSSSTDFIYQFPEYRKNVVSIKVDAIELPRTWYMFYSPMNTFTINGISVTIPEGNYTVDELNTWFDTNAPYIHIHTTSLKTVITGSYTVDFTTSVVQQQSAGWVLGFRSAQYVTTTSITSEGTYGVVDHYFFLEIDDFQHNFMTDSIVSTVVNKGTPTFLGNNIIARIPVNGSIFGDNQSQFKRDYFGPVTLERLRIRLLNKFGEVVSLQSNDFSFSLELKELYS